MQNELKPCPFCGGEAVFKSIRIGGTGASGMEAPDLTAGCPSCQIWLPAQRTEDWEQGKGTFSICNTVKAALLDTWNTRAAVRLAKDEQLKKSGFEILRQYTDSCPPNGVKNGPMEEAFDCKIAVTLIFDDRGRVFQFAGGRLSSGGITQVFPARRSVLELMDHLGTSDIKWTVDQNDST